MLNPVWLTTFVTAAQSSSFTEAGRRLKLTQSTVSDHISRLETAIGRRLFIRDTHSLALTPDGESMLIHARLILEAHEKAKLHFAGPPLRGRIRLGSSDDMAMGRLPEVLARFRRLHPEVELDLTIGFTDDLLRQLDAGSLDLMTGKRRPGETRGQRLYSESLVWMGRDETVLAEPLSLVLLSEPSITRAVTLDSIARSQVRWRIACNSSSYAGCAAAARAGLGVTALPRHLSMPGLSPVHGLPPLPDIEYIAVIASDADKSARTLLRILEESDLG